MSGGRRRTALSVVVQSFRVESVTVNQIFKKY